MEENESDQEGSRECGSEEASEDAGLRVQDDDCEDLRTQDLKREEQEELEEELSSQEQQLQQRHPSLMPGGTPSFLPHSFPLPPTSSPLLPPTRPPDPPSHTSWCFEDQFKQLYELDNDPKRKEFLDDLFSFMHKRGTPINRLPIMAKQVLDLYTLFNLVIARGGLVEVINKKLWQEVIKGLNLPSSITSAAFTLRTQYMKYLYPFECARQRLSSPEDLQAAIGANVRGDGKGKKSSSPSNFSTFQDLIHAGARGSPLPAQIPSIGMVQSRAGSMFNGNSTSPAAAAAAAHFLSSVPGFPASTNANAALLDMQARISMWNKLLLNHMGGEEPQEKGAGGGRREELERHLLGSGIIPPPQYEALNLADAKKSCSSEKRSYSPPLSSKKGNKRSWAEIDDNEDDRLDRHRSNTSPRTTIKISSRGESEGGGVDNSIVVCLEVNEVVYQGVLFAQKKRDCIS